MSPHPAGHAELVEALKPCPFCGDRMQIRHGVLRHRKASDCLIAAYTWDNGWSYKWNTRAALASEAASQMPADGWVLVPKEPTEAMLQAIAWADWKGERDLGWADGYRIMLEAAPDHEGPADGK